jgi:uncharacterized membrane protein YoaK (UPF0700 family)
MGAINELLQLSLWKKSIVGLFTVMWIAFTGAIVANLASPWYGLTVILCMLWLVYVGAIYWITNTS